MRVAVAGIATGKLEVRLALMALAAERNYFPDSRRVAGVTILATD
jgi:hypothetical protein